MKQGLDRFPAIKSPEVDSFLSDAARLSAIADPIGTPFHVVFPEAISGNIQAFREVLSASGLGGDVLYAAKANKSDSAGVSIKLYLQ